LQVAVVPVQEIKLSITPINVSGLPVRITGVSAERSLQTIWFNYSINNTSTEDINRVDLRVFITDSDGTLISTQDTTDSDRIVAGATQKGKTFIKTTIGAKGLTLLAVTRVVTHSGIWQVDQASLEAAVRSGLSCERECHIGATFEPHVVVTDSDRIQIFEVIVKDLLDDQRKRARLQDHSYLIVLRSSVNFALPDISGKRLVALSESEIQEIADQEKQVVFVKYEPLIVEGSRVIAKLAVRDAVTRRRGAFVQYKYMFVFTCVKEKDKWLIEKSIGYAQS
jgi:hypothetical protein